MIKEKVENKNKIINFIIRIFWIFVIGSIFGFFIEMLYTLVYTRDFQIRKGLIYGPFIPIYGIGAVAYYLLISKIKEPKEVFFAGMFMGGVLEYLCSFFQEIWFGTISWDYSERIMNLNGRVCLLYCVYWGIIAILFLKVIYPWFEKIDNLIYKKSIIIVTIFSMLFMVFNISISCMAADRQQERRNNISADSKIDIFLDNNYPDELLDKVYNNKKEIN